MNYQDYLKTEKFPTVWCPGCGLGIVLRETARAFQELEYKKEDTTVISGIGCTGRSAGYFNLDTFHGAHGRAIPVAEGMKLANPKLHVTVLSGDGDITGIGGNHLLHASRRNTNITVICVVNETYGLTGGQMAPTAPKGTKTKTSPKGSAYEPVNIQGLITQNKNYLYARTSAVYPDHMRKSIKEALQHEGFSFVEIRSPCYSSHGRNVGFKNFFEMYQDLKVRFKMTSKDTLEEDELGIIKK